MYDTDGALQLAAAIVSMAVDDMLYNLNGMYRAGRVDNSYGQRPYIRKTAAGKKNIYQPLWKSRGLEYYRKLFASDYFSLLTLGHNDGLFRQTIQRANDKIIRQYIPPRYKYRSREYFEARGMIPKGKEYHIKVFEIGEDGKVGFATKEYYQE